MREIDTRVVTYEMVNNMDYDGNTLSYMLPAVQGAWVSVAEHEDVVIALQDRITVLENVCDEQMKMLTGD